ncbi:PEP-CTERM sorting domain-containing protein [uncultured Lamprocystis sp.]|jgi:hypothetical protein|uniref:PEP-CTERM sorting domain-containing protein n=1 Tax=uncultured Lamprocystis sp. TaxID=543132 RepID=UPI0025DA6E56|nr:PEP-CTERM sorting domain-containing protein [uncultured Lamprocystis sp.]
MRSGCRSHALEGFDLMFSAAFNTIANEPIRAGQLTDASPVPEPASLFSTVCLAASALVLRRRSGLSSPTISTPLEI